MEEFQRSVIGERPYKDNFADGDGEQVGELAFHADNLNYPDCDALDTAHTLGIGGRDRDQMDGQAEAGTSSLAPDDEMGEAQVSTGQDDTPVDPITTLRSQAEIECAALSDAIGAHGAASPGADADEDTLRVTLYEMRAVTATKLSI